MKKTKWNRLLSLFLTGVLSAATLAGCGQQEKDSQETSAVVSEEKGAGEVSEKVPEEPVKYRIAIYRPDPRENAFLEDESNMYYELAAKHNIEIEWVIYNDWVDKKAFVLMGGDDMPDAFWGSNCFNLADVEANKDLFLNLTDLVKENMPNLVAAMEDDPTLKYFATNLNGEIWTLPKKLPCRPLSGQMPFINKKWLDVAGLDVPTDLDGLYKALKAFKELDVNENGDVDDEIPFLDILSLARDVRGLLMYYNLSTGTDGYFMHLDEAGELEYAPATEEFKEGVKWVHKLYSEGLLDPESPTMDYTMRNSKRASGLAGVLMLWHPYDALGKTSEFANDYVPLNVAGIDGKVHIDYYDTLNYSSGELVLSKNCEKPEKLLQFADEFYTTYNTLRNYWGTDYVEEKKDGTYFVKDASGEGLWNVAMRDFGPMYVSVENEEKVVFEDGHADANAVIARAEHDTHYSNDVSRSMPFMKYTPEESEALATLKTDVTGYSAQKYVEWAVNGNVEEEWDTYLEELKAYGYDEYMKIHTDAYERYKAEIGK